jgi:hypothetical protein
MSVYVYLYKNTCKKACKNRIELAMNYFLFEHKHSFRDYFFRPQHMCAVSMVYEKVAEHYKLVFLILCVNFSTKFRLIEISFSGGLFIIVDILKPQQPPV